jgi:hypothetical protein
MKRWALLVAALYIAILAVLTVPVCLLAFVPNLRLENAAGIYLAWPYWLWLAVMLAGQFMLLAVPVRVASLRPVTRGPIWRTVLAGGLMAGGLAAGAVLSLYEFVFRDRDPGNWSGWTAITLGVVTWCIWARVFFRMNRNAPPTDIVSRQCQWLFKGSILELLIAVPTHVVARYRGYCCAGFMTFVGLTMGVSVMLFSFGPAVFFLFVERWKRLHPQVQASQADANEIVALNPTNK